MTKPRHEFRKNPKDGIHLSAEELPYIARAYEKKYKIRIIINGETPFGKKIIQSHISEYNDLLKNLSDESIKYAAYLTIFWKNETFPPTLKISPDYGWDINEKFKIKISSFLDENGNFKKNMSYQDLEKLANILDEFPTFKNLIAEKIESAKKVLEFTRDVKGLNRNQVKKEVSQIQNSLGKNQSVGYFFTNGCRNAKGHFEVLIISKDKIIRPADWRVDSKLMLYQHHLDVEHCKFVDSRLDGLVHDQVTCIPPDYRGPIKGGPPAAQASDIECGTLGMIYLKELLKKNGEQLGELSSLTIPWYSSDIFGEENLRYFFMPPPQILRYSQSRTYNEVIKAMIAGDSTKLITLESPLKNPLKKSLIHKKFTFKSLEMILTETKDKAINKPNSKAIVEECNRLLYLLPTFRKDWLKEYEQVEIEHNKMRDNEGKNQYLSYKSIHLHEKGQEEKNMLEQIEEQILDEVIEEREKEWLTETTLGDEVVIQNLNEIKDEIKSASKLDDNEHEYKEENKYQSLSTSNEESFNPAQNMHQYDVSWEKQSYQNINDIKNELKKLSSFEKIGFLKRIEGHKNIFNLANLKQILEIVSEPDEQSDLIKLLGTEHLKDIVTIHQTFTDLLKLLKPAARTTFFETLGNEHLTQLFKLPLFLIKTIEDLQKDNKEARNGMVLDLMKYLGDEPLLCIMKERAKAAKRKGLTQFPKYDLNPEEEYHRFTPWQGSYDLSAYEKYFQNLEGLMKKGDNVLHIYQGSDLSKKISITYSAAEGGWIVIDPLSSDSVTLVSRNAKDVAKKIFLTFSSDNKVINLSTEFCTLSLLAKNTFYNFDKEVKVIADQQVLDCLALVNPNELTAVQEKLMQDAFSSNNIDLCKKLIEEGGVNFYGCNFNSCKPNDNLFNELCEVQAKFNILLFKNIIIETKWNIKVGGEFIPELHQKVPKTVFAEWNEIQAAESGKKTFYDAWEKIIALKKEAAIENDNLWKFFRGKPARDHYKKQLNEPEIVRKKAITL